MVFGQVPLWAKLTDAGTGAGLGGQPVSFSVDGGAPLAATTAADGTATATPQLPLAPGAHTVAVRFAGDASHLGSMTTAAVNVVNAIHGSVTAVVLRLAAGGAAELHVQTGPNAKLLGNLVYDDGPVGRKPFAAATITGFGIAADGRTAWIAGRNDAGHTFLAQAVDTRGHADTLRLWIDGVLVDGTGAIRLGLVRVTP